MQGTNGHAGHQVSLAFRRDGADKSVPVIEG